MYKKYMSSVHKTLDSGKSRKLLENNVFISNSLSDLIDILIHVIKEQKYQDPKRILLIIPSNLIKNFFIQAFQQREGVFSGIRILTLPQAMEHLCKISAKKDLNPPSHMNLFLHIVEKIKDYAPAYSEKEQILLAKELSHIYLQYGLYAKEAFDDLDFCDPDKRWILELFADLQKVWDFPIQLQELDPKFGMYIHHVVTFPMPSLTKNCLEKCSRKCPVNTYFYSPSPLFWGDLLSRKKAARLDQKLSLQNASISERVDLQKFLLDTNNHMANAYPPLISFWENLLENDPVEAYREPANRSLLEKIQHDIYHLTMTKKEKDESLTIHETPSYMREIEVIHQKILDAIYSTKIDPEEICVYTPKIERYLPFIQYVFTSPESPVGFIAKNVSKTYHNHSLLNIKKFFDLVDSRFDVKSVLDLLGCAQGINEEHICILQKVMDFLHTDWGFDQAMRQEALQDNTVESYGSFQDAFDYILDTLAFDTSILALNELEIWGDVQAFLTDLYQDIKTLQTESMQIGDWIVYLQNILKKLFPKSDALDFVLKEINRLHALSPHTTHLFSYAAVQEIIKEIFSQKGQTISSGKRPQIHFCPLQEGVVVEKDFIILLGMDEESYPRVKDPRSLDILQKHPRIDKKLQSVERDVLLFFHAIAFAKKMLMITYTSVSEKDRKTQTYSFCLEDLIQDIGSDIIQKHTSFAFSPKALQSRHYSQKHYEMYLAKKSPLQKLELSCAVLEKESNLCVSCKELDSCMKHPVKFYLNYSLGIYLDTIDAEKMRKEREFLLTYVDRAQFKKSFLEHSLAALLQDPEKRHLLPKGSFANSAKKELQEIFTEVFDACQTFQLAKEDFLDVTISPSAEKTSEIFSQKWITPLISGKTKEGDLLHIYGSLSNISRKGLVCWGKLSLKTLWGAWPSFLLMRKIFPEIPAQFLFIEEKKIHSIDPFDVDEGLTSCLTYYAKAKKEPSSLFVEKNFLFPDPYLAAICVDEDTTLWEEDREAICRHFCL